VRRTLKPGASRRSNKRLRAFDAPVAIAVHMLSVGITIGCAVAPFDGSDREALLRRADVAMYAAKCRTPRVVEGGSSQGSRPTTQFPSVAPS
jgi:predicted signal transduction protein with EAL and GGDEF domain